MSARSGPSVQAKDRGEVDRWDEALQWHTVFQAGGANLSPAKIGEWQRWIADEGNRAIFARLCPTLEHRAQLQRPALPSAESLAADTYDPEISVAEWQRRQQQGTGATERRPPGPARRHGYRVPGFVLAGMVLIVALIVTTVPRGMIHRVIRSPLTAHSPAQATGIGQLKALHLADGSTITLGADSAIRIHYTVGRRAVTLDRGEAWFQVAHDRSRPFVVSAGVGEVVATGTAFVVQRYANRVTVTVTDGTVEITRAAASPSVGADHPVRPAPIARVTRGERVSYDATGTVTPVAKADLAAATAWSQGRLQFDRQRLGEVIALVNRYVPEPIAVDAPSSQLLFSGIVFAESDDIQQWVAALPQVLPVQIQRQGDRVCVRLREGNPIPPPCVIPP